MKQIKEKLNKEENKGIKKRKIDKKILLIIIFIIIVIAISALAVKFFTSENPIDLPFLTNSLTVEFLSKNVDVDMEITDIITSSEVNTDKYTTLVFVRTSDGLVHMLLANLETDEVRWVGISEVLSRYITVAFDNNASEKVVAYMITKISNEGYNCFETEDYETQKSILKDVSNLTDIKKCRDAYVEWGLASYNLQSGGKVYLADYNKYIDNVIFFFEPGTACPANIVAYESLATVFNPNFPITEAAYNLFKDDYSQREFLKQCEKLAGGPAYIITSVYSTDDITLEKDSFPVWESISKIEEHYKVEVYNSTETISKENLEKLLANDEDNYVGIGVYIKENNNYNKVEIISVIKDSPAEKAGIKSGDLILKVDEIEYTANDKDNIANKLKGQEGTTVTMEILRDKSILNFEITREKIDPNVLEGKSLSDNIGYIKFTEFNKTTAEEFKNTYEDLNKQGIQSLIIDLRNNTGGYIDQSIEIANYIVDEGSIILYEFGENKDEKAIKSNNSPFINLPIIILTNGWTAGASEILTGALQDSGKAKVIGEKTYGKGVIQRGLRLTDGSGKITNVGEYLTPNKKRIQDIGIEPNETVILQDTASEDTQLQRAIELLH